MKAAVEPPPFHLLPFTLAWGKRSLKVFCSPFSQVEVVKERGGAMLVGFSGQQVWSVDASTDSRLVLSKS